MSHRTFHVVVTARKLIYPPQDAALRCMRTLRERGYETEALTTANDINESLTLAEMEAVYDRCPDCGHTPATGACFYCKMD